MTEIVKKEYNYCMDFLKGIACIFVVFIHVKFPGSFGQAVQAVARFAVPFFFMVSGYYCYRKDYHGVMSAKGVKRKVIHIAKITLYASLFYLAFVLIQQALFHNQDLTISKGQVFFWLVLNHPSIIAGQYWFLFALLYAYIFYGVLEYFNLRRFAYVLAVILFVVYICLAQGAHVAGFCIDRLYYRNWLVEAFPYFMLGHWIHENEERIDISNKALLSLLFVATILCCVERWVMGRNFGVNICSIPQVFALFLYGVKNPNRHKGVIQLLGRDCSMLVYIIHPAMWHILDGIYDKIGLIDNPMAQYLRPIIVLMISVLLALIFNSIVTKIKVSKAMTNN